jgi:hypothetical protein
VTQISAGRKIKNGPTNKDGPTSKEGPTTKDGPTPRLEKVATCNVQPGSINIQAAILEK